MYSNNIPRPSGSLDLHLAGRARRLIPSRIAPTRARHLGLHRLLLRLRADAIAAAAVGRGVRGPLLALAAVAPLHLLHGLGRGRHGVVRAVIHHHDGAGRIPEDGQLALHRV